MEFLLDDSAIEQQFQKILHTIRLYKNGEVAANLKSRGINYKMNWGVSIMDLRKIAADFSPSHLLALKLWNKQWRETMILATLLDEPGKVTEQQMDFWTKSFENSEIAEQASANLWWKSPFAYIKALEWCRGKKHWLHYTAIHLIGRLAMMDKKSPDEMFESFFEELATLAKDEKLSTVIERSSIIMAHRSDYLEELVSEFVTALKDSNLPVALQLAGNIEAGI
jgi:3-methyladenine DNA glycosylase AlkD